MDKGSVDKKVVPSHYPPPGRPTGAGHRRNNDLIKMAREMGVDPFRFLLEVVRGNWQAMGYDGPMRTVPTKDGDLQVESIPLDLRVKAAREACQYLYARRKAIEISTEGGAPFIAIEKPDGTKMIMGNRGVLETDIDPTEK